MTKLSVNINKIATLRNARGGDRPNVMQAAKDCERFGAEGITVHPRPDERHIRYQDVYDLKEVVTTEFNIEGNPTPDFLKLVKEIKPAQATLVPDAPDAITSNAGWDTLKHKDFLTDVILELKELGIRTSIFVDPNEKIIEGAALVGTDRVELYTEDYARNYFNNREQAIAPYLAAARKAQEFDIGLNAGHDLDLDNLKYLHDTLPGLLEVSIGHALICDALYFGLENTIQRYLRELK
ncbi:pyridoxine 5-phosphate synthase [Pontibacter aydingkolensis]|uniref:Pyridoxine 5'-phosphate synthase n=1 Tax=Pontibacter aydingkolensis TaxID=1911536 RepID=A0ABS7CWW2_9BACT|nr:pyridoxine 5'-phosphate synthase [Pontibacter aydingkolensis]MBW7468268.1 pyridoxine 5'-phosphate synthase [Pontibacter aydingkolensis]